MHLSSLYMYPVICCENKNKKQVCDPKFCSTLGFCLLQLSILSPCHRLKRSVALILPSLPPRAIDRVRNLQVWQISCHSHRQRGRIMHMPRPYLIKTGLLLSSSALYSSWRGVTQRPGLA